MWAYVYMHASMKLYETVYNMYTQARVCLDLHTCLHVHTYVHTYIRTHIKTHTQKHTRTHIYNVIHAYIYNILNIHTYMHVRRSAKQRCLPWWTNGAYNTHRVGPITRIGRSSNLDEVTMKCVISSM